jgi:hypothetical protein
MLSCCSSTACPNDTESAPSPVPKSTTKREKESLLEMYGYDDQSDDEALPPADGPMSPCQVKTIIDRQIALTQEDPGG